MKNIILASHGNLSQGMFETVKMIVGDIANSIKVYNMYPGDTAEDFARNLSKEIENNATDEYVILTDLFGASVCTALSKLTVYDNVTLFSGMNINIVLEVLLSYPENLTNSDKERLIETARDGIQLVQIEEFKQSDENDF